MGVNGFAVQVLNFETNFFTHTEAGGINGDLTNAEVPLLVPGYHISNIIANYYNGEGAPFSFDVIEILMADGSKKLLRNTTASFLEGFYVDNSRDAYGYAKVEFYTTALRSVWYKPGDGLTYYFEEEFTKLNGTDFSGNSDPKALYLKEIYSPVGDTVYFDYDDYFHPEYPIVNGRKIFKSLSINREVAYPNVNQQKLEVYYEFFDFFGTVRLYQIFVKNLVGSRLTFITDINSQTNLIGTVRDPLNDRRVNIIAVQDELFRVDRIYYNNPQEREFVYYNSTNVFIKSYLPGNIIYHTGRETEFTYFEKKFVDPIGNEVIHLDWPVRYNIDNMQFAMRDCLTNYMIKKRKQINGNGLIKTEKYAYNYSGPTGTIGDPLVGNIKTTISVTSNLNNGSEPSGTKITKSYSRYNTGYNDYILGDYSKSLKLNEEIIKETGTDNESKNSYVWIIGQIPAGSTFYNGEFNLKSLTKTKATGGLLQSHMVSNKNYTLAGFLGKQIVTSETNHDGKSITKETIFKNFIPTELNDINAFYKIGLIDEEKIFSGSKIKNNIKNIYYDATHNPTNNPQGIFRGKLKKSYTNYNSRPSETYFKYNSWVDDSLYRGYLKSVEFDNDVEQAYRYPQRIRTNFGMKFAVKDSIIGKIVYYDKTTKDSLFVAKGYQNKPSCTYTIFNNGLDTLSTFTDYHIKGNLMFEIDVNGNYSEFTYDKLNRITSATLPGSFVEVDSGVSYQHQTIVADTLVFGNKYGSYITQHSDGTTDNKILKIVKLYDENIPTESPKGAIDKAVGGGGEGDEEFDTTWTLKSRLCYIFFKEALNTNNIESMISLSFLLHANNVEVPDPSESLVIEVTGVDSDSSLYGNPATFTFEQSTLFSENEIDIMSIINQFKAAGKLLIGFQFDSSPLTQHYPNNSYKSFAFECGHENSIYPMLVIRYQTTITDTLFASGTAFLTYDDVSNTIYSMKRFSNHPDELETTIEEKAEYDDFGLLKQVSRKNSDDEFILISNSEYNSQNLKYKQEDAENRESYAKYDYLQRPVEERYDSNYGDEERRSTDYLLYSGTDYFEYTKVTDEEDNITESYIDEVGNLKSVKKYKGTQVIETKYYYNNIYQLDSVVTPGGKATSYVYDDHGNVKERTTPDEGTTKYKYDKYGNLRFSLNSAAPVNERGL
ncbi:hypothetical protein ACFLSH_03910, partial [Bacteroidota bacterium]